MFAGDDGVMTLDEATKMKDMIRKEFAAKAHGEFPEMSDEYFKRSYDVYNALGDGEGFTKAEA